MERDALIAHGIFGFMNERDMVRGDKFYVFVSTVNGEIAIANHQKNIYFDAFADGPVSYHLEDGTGQGKRSIIGLNTLKKRQTGFVRLAIPYSMKLLIHELNGLGMRLRLQPRIVKLLVDREESGHMDDLLIHMQDLIHEDEEEVADLLTKSISEQIEQQIDLEDKIVESYQNAETKKPLFEYKAEQMQQMEMQQEREMEPVADTPIFKHPDELPHPRDVMPIIPPNMGQQPVIESMPQASLAPIQDASLNQSGGGVPAPVHAVPMQSGGFVANPSVVSQPDMQSQKRVSFDLSANPQGTYMSEMGPVEIPELEGGSAEDEFDLTPLAQSGPGIQTGGAPSQPNPETKVINISGNERDLAELALMK
jgi:hypothetical protein